MTEKINNISQIIRSTEEYSDVCDMCRDEILLYPTISGRTEYTQDEVEQITLKRIIDKLRAKEQECEELKKEKAEIKKYLGISDKTIIQRLEELQEFKDKLKISEYSYKQALDEIEKTIDNGTADTQTNNAKWLHEYYLARYCEIRDIINKVKEQ